MIFILAFKVILTDLIYHFILAQADLLALYLPTGHSILIKMTPNWS